MKPENEHDENNDNKPEDTSSQASTTDSSTPESGDTSSSEPARTPADALSRTPEDLAEEEAEHAKDHPTGDQPEIKKVSPIKRFFRKANLYVLLFFVIVAVVAAITIVSYLNSQKDPVVPDIAAQELTDEALQQLANTDASVGNASQTLTIQGNAVIDGQTLMRGNLNVAGNFQSGGSIQGTGLTISGESNLGETQIDNLQIAGTTAIQGNTTMRDLTVAGTTSLNGAVTASQLTVTRLILSGNATLEVPNHISFTGPAPSRSINRGTLGGGGSASVNGSDTTGTVNINTGNNPSAGCYVRINFNQQFSKQLHVLISPVGAAAGRTQYYVDRNQSGFSICASAPAPANQALAFDYFVTN